MPSTLFVLMCAFWVLLNCTANAAPMTATASKPNIVLFFVDDMGWGDVGFNNRNVTETPTIDKYARKGMILTDFHAGATFCTPSRAARLTGRLGLRSGVWGQFGPNALYGMPTNETTIPEYLRQAGYYSGAIGKWHLGTKAPFHPSYRFDYYYGVPYSLDMGCTNVPGDKIPTWQTCQQDHSRAALPLIESTLNCSQKDCNQNIIEQPVNLTTLTARYVIKAQQVISTAQDQHQPFFLYVPFSHVHVPLAVQGKFVNASGRGIFGDVLMELDNAVEQIIQHVIDVGEEDNTLIIFTSDNGPWEQECDFAGSVGPYTGQWQADHAHGGATGKFTTWEGGHREPFFAYWPGRIEAGATSAALTSAMDILPTLLALAGVDLPSDRTFDGVDLGPVLFHQKDTVREILVHPDDSSGQLSAMRYNDLKIFFRTYSDTACGDYSGDNIVHYFPLAFNVTADPSESTPISLTLQQVQKFERALYAINADIKSSPRSIADYTLGTFYDAPCCDASEPVCSCPGQYTTTGPHT